MTKSLAELFTQIGESVRRRKSAEEHDTGVLRAGAKALSSAVAESEDTPDDLLILACAPEAFKVAYPRSKPWSGSDLHELLSKMRNLMQAASSGKPVIVYDLDELLEFCISMRELLILKANNQR